MTARPLPEAAPQPTFPEAVRVWLKIGLTSFGGPAGQIALMHRELVDERRWIDEARFLHGLNFCMLLPGPEAMQLATYIGWRLHGLKGGLVAGLLFVLPGFFVILALSTAYVLFQSTAWFTALFFGLKAAVLAIVVEALARVARKSLKGRSAYVIAGLSFLALFAFAVPFPLVILAAAIAGYAMQVQAATAARAPAGMAADRSAGRWFAPGHATRVLCLWGSLWLVAFGAAAVAGGGLWLDLAGFFSQMAVVTFGGAYAVLAYVAQAAVETYGWLQPGQMIDGLALAETTPGPLILVLTFVGFVAAYQQPGDWQPLVAGLFGATLTTWVTFVPCFLWIFLGAPAIDRLRDNTGLAGALAAIGAAVVGVILNLSVWFALQTLFGRVEKLEAGPLAMAWPDWTSLNLPAAVLAVVAFVALFRLKLGMIPTMVLCGALGAGVKLAGW